MSVKCDPISRAKVQENLDEISSSIEDLEQRRVAAKSLLDKLPVELTATQYDGLMRRSGQLAKLEELVRPCLRIHRDPAEAADHLIEFLSGSDVLRGIRI